MRNYAHKKKIPMMILTASEVWLDSQHEMAQPMFIGQIVKAKDGVEPRIIAHLGHWTSSLLGANGGSSVG
jgi:hypothetical protein